MSDRIARNQAIEIWGRAKFGDAWVGTATDEEFKLAKKYRLRFATGAKLPADEAHAVYEAEEREARADRQHREVIQSLENRGLDCVRGLGEGLDRNEFDRAFKAEFGRPKPTAISKHTRYATDEDLVRKALEGIKTKKYPNPLKAAQALASKAEGGSYEAKIDRLRRKISRASSL